MADDDLAATLAGIRADIEETAYVYNLDGAGKNSYPVSVAMIRHARPLLAAVEAARSFHVEAVKYHVEPESQFRYCKTCSGHPAWPCPEVAAIGAALTGTQPSEDENRG